MAPARMDFDRLASWYGALEAIAAGPLMQRARTHWLDALAGHHCVLSVGEGHGRFAAAFLRRFPDARLTCVDASAAMIRRARGRTASAGRAITWVMATLPPWRPPAGSFDAVVTCFVLDCFPPETLREVVGALSNGAAHRASWLVVDFAIPDRGWVRLRARVIVATLYFFFRLTARIPARQLTEPDALLRAAGFERVARREFSWGLIRADLWRRGA
ncbi:MAG: class I SAM-dependent methyltransferase [Vicinamibacterales bacterium]